MFVCRCAGNKSTSQSSAFVDNQTLLNAWLAMKSLGRFASHVLCPKDANQSVPQIPGKKQLTQAASQQNKRLVFF